MKSKNGCAAFDFFFVDFLWCSSIFQGHIFEPAVEFDQHDVQSSSGAAVFQSPLMGFDDVNHLQIDGIKISRVDERSRSRADLFLHKHWKNAAKIFIKQWKATVLEICIIAAAVFVLRTFFREKRKTNCGGFGSVVRSTPVVLLQFWLFSFVQSLPLHSWGKKSISSIGTSLKSSQVEKHSTKMILNLVLSLLPWGLHASPAFL